MAHESAVPGPYLNSRRGSVTGRLLVVALFSGTVIGWVVAAMMMETSRTVGFGSALPAAIVMGVFGIPVGMVLAMVAQSANLLVVALARKRLDAAGPVAQRLALMPLPILGAAIFFVTSLTDPRSWPMTLTSVLLTAAAVWLFTPWCLAPGSPKVGQAPADVVVDGAGVA